MMVSTFNVGLAASSGSLLFLAAPVERRKAYNYSRLMIHNPLYPDEPDKVDEVLEQFVSMLAEFYTDHSGGHTKEEMMEIMRKETWMDVNVMIQSGLMLEENVVRTERKIAATTPQEICKIAASMIEKKESKKQDMKSIALLLGLTETATEIEISAAIEKLKGAKEDLGTQVTDLEAKVTDLEAKVEAAVEAEAEAVVEAAIKDGKFDPEEKDDLTVQAKASLDQFKAIAAKIKPATKAARVSATIKGDPSNEDTNEVVNGKLNGKSLRELEKESPDVVAKIYKEQPDIYAKLYEAQYKTVEA